MSNSAPYASELRSHMPFAPHVRVSALGRLGSAGGDRFSYSLNLGRQDDVVAQAVLQNNDDAWQDLADDVADFHGGPFAAGVSNFVDANAVLDTVKIAHIGSDGKYTTDPRIYSYSRPGPIAAASNNATLPQSALAISLLTERRGPRGKGRFYLPMPRITADPANSFRMPVADAEAIRASVVGLINNINNQPGVDFVDLHVVVASTFGFNTRVDSVRVGRVVDTIRSRRNALGEAYTAPLGVAE